MPLVAETMNEHGHVGQARVVVDYEAEQVGQMHRLAWTLARCGVYLRYIIDSRPLFFGMRNSPVGSSAMYMFRSHPGSTSCIHDTLSPLRLATTSALPLGPAGGGEDDDSCPVQREESEGWESEDQIRYRRMAPAMARSEMETEERPLDIGDRAFLSLIVYLFRRSSWRLICVPLFRCHSLHRRQPVI